jgi:SAM-dependent methyltransferase
LGGGPEPSSAKVSPRPILGSWGRCSVSSWRDDPAVAAGQQKVVEGELAAFKKAWPFVMFARAMEGILAIAPEKVENLLDVGCGCGHYGQVLDQAFHWVRYHGCDFSPHMVEVAKKLNPGNHIWQCSFEEVNFDLADIVLLSQVIEYTERPLEALKKLKEIPRWVILHKIRTTAKSSHLIQEGTYAGHSEQCMLWNVTELTQRLWLLGINLVGLPFSWDRRGDIITLVGKNKNYG